MFESLCECGCPWARGPLPALSAVSGAAFGFLLWARCHTAKSVFVHGRSFICVEAAPLGFEHSCLLGFPAIYI